MSIKRTLVALGMALVVVAPAARGQGDTTGRVNRPASVMRGRQGRGPGMDRMRIQRQIRQAFTHAVRSQVGLDDEQMQKLAPINRKYAAQRQDLARQERGIRTALRDELAKAEPDQDSVAKLSDQLQDFSRRRVDLNDAEEKELSGIMTPVQLAKYRALQERVQRQLNMMRPPMMGGDPRPLPIPDSVSESGSRR